MVARGLGLRRKSQRVPIIIVEPTDDTVSQTPITDDTPDDFTFFDIDGVVGGETQTSNTVTISGLEGGIFVAASISGNATSEFQKNGGSWQTDPVSVQNDDTLAVRHVTSAVDLSTDTTLTVGTVSDTFTSTRASSGTAGEPLGLLLALTKAA